ncbi:hypothetical protein M8J75_009124 [Diaphorina citri]|nr:hypothetical protein M8J75_009124 [Diaphorina citri]
MCHTCTIKHVGKSCQELSKDLGYVLYSALGSFYIPSCIMVFVYIRIYYAAKARARRGIRKTGQKSTGSGGIPMVKTSVKSGSTGATSPMGGSVKQVPVLSSLDRNANSPLAVVLESKPPPIPIVTCDFASDISTSDAGLDGELMAREGSADPGGGEPEIKIIKDTLKVSALKPSAASSGAAFKSSSLSINNGEIQTISVQTRNRTHSAVGIDNDMISEFEPSSSDSGVIQKCTTKIRPLKFKFYKPIFNHINKKSSKQKRDIIDIGNKIGESSISVAHKSRDPEREKRRIARKKEKRATLILGLIMGSFIACWLPFFFLYILTPICKVCRDTIPDKAFAVAFWLGYMNSALNPVIYTIFNKDFRRAFRRILFK